MPENLDIRRKRLAFRAWHRGTKELDLLIALLEVPEPVMYRWATGQEAPSAGYDHDVMKLLLEFKIPR
jgi:antitoxin CptB